MGDVIVALDGAPHSGSASSAFRAFAVGTSVTFGLASAGVNFLEHASGLDIDRDGESGAMGRLALRRRSESSTAERALRRRRSTSSSLSSTNVQLDQRPARRRRSTFPSTSEKFPSTSETFRDHETSPRRRRSSQKSKHSDTSSEGQIPPLQQQGAPSPVFVPAVDELGKISTSDELTGAMSPGMSVIGASGRSRRRTSSVRPRTKIGTSDELVGAMSPGLSVTGGGGRSCRRTSSVRPRTESTEEGT